MEQETTAGKGEEMEQEVQRSYWIDAAKLVAILGGPGRSYTERAI